MKINNYRFEFRLVDCGVRFVSDPRDKELPNVIKSSSGHVVAIWFTMRVVEHDDGTVEVE